MVRAFAPGRVNIVGEHTDYNEGLALPFAIALGVTVVAETGGGTSVEAIAVDLGESDAFTIADPGPAPGWRAFVRGTVAELTSAGHSVPGTRLRISGTLPQGAGLSSSAALEVALCLALVGTMPDSDATRLELARLCSRVEGRWVGAHTGLLDQLASLSGISGHAMRIDFNSLTVQPVPMHLDGWTLVTVDSGTTRRLAPSGYNERRRECGRVLEMLGASSMRAVSAGELVGLPEVLRRRARHVIDENVRVDRAAAALADGDPASLAEVLNESHRSLRDLYEVSTPEVEATVRRLRRDGAGGARLMGGGFGGHVLALLPPGVRVPGGALVVTPGGGARILPATRGS